MARHKLAKGIKKIPGSGRSKGTPNKTTKLTRELITNLIESQFEHMLKALEKIRIKQPARYIDIMQAFMEYALPKLSRKELVGDPDQPIQMNFQNLGIEDLKKLSEIIAKTKKPTDQEKKD